MDIDLIKSEIEKVKFILVERNLIPHERNALEKYLDERIKYKMYFLNGIGN